MKKTKRFILVAMIVLVLSYAEGPAFESRQVRQKTPKTKRFRGFCFIYF